MSLRPHGPTIFLLLILIGALGWSLHEGPEPPLALALLLPGDADTQDPRVSAWRHAAQTEGLPLAIIRDDVFLRPTMRKPIRYAGVIVPDGLHPVASGILIGRLQNYVERGGKLMVVYDAATLSPPGHIPAVRQSHLSKLVGVDYAAYGQLGSPASRTLATAPAKIPAPSLLIGPHGMAKRDGPASLSMVTFVREEKQYAHLVATGVYRGLILSKSNDGRLITGLHQSGKGQVALVNVELGALGARSDPAPLHRFLHWFGTDVCGLPGMPSRGGRVENTTDKTSSSLLDNRESLKRVDHGPGLARER